MTGLKIRLSVPVICACSLLFLLPALQAAESGYAGRPVQEVLDEFQQQGLALVYSTNLVTPSLRVISEPGPGSPVEKVREILEPHGLSLTGEGDPYLVVRTPAPESPPVQDNMPATPSSAQADGPLVLETLSVSASRYILFSNSQFFIDQRAIQALPNLGQDPIRSTHRLPGTAAGGLSSRSHFRGGEHNETAIYLNGLKLLDPFHIRDYHNIFSSIDARAISGVEAYTGGFPAQFGDSMSGVLILDSKKSEEPLHTELGLSAYNTSFFNSGFTADSSIDWLVSARISNLDWFLPDRLGKPDYFDVFAELGFNLSDSQRLSLNGHYSDDQVIVITEDDPAELERSDSDTLNQNFWLLLESQWTTFLSSQTILSYSRLENTRKAESNDPERLLALVYDDRDAEIIGLQQNWSYDGLADHSLRWGFGVRWENARYQYHARAEYPGFFEFYPGIENPTVRDVAATPDGRSYSLFLSDRWRLTDSSTLELGLRWDRQTYTEMNYDGQLSPRVSFMSQVGDSTELRLTWGRYYQSQAIQELQVEDGINRFFAPQRAEHWIAGVQHLFDGGYRLRLEAFLKNYDRLKPRYENLFDPLVLIPELAPDRVMLAPESARVAGVETTLESRNNEELDWWISYTLSRATDRIDGVRQQRSWDQRHALQGGLAWQRGLWELGVAVSVHSGWPTTGLTFESVPIEPESPDDDDVIYLPVPGPRNAEQLGMFAQLDFRISREFPVKIGRLAVFFELTNATDRKNECCIDYDLDEDEDGNVFLDRSVDHWLPILPAAGISWEF